MEKKTKIVAKNTFMLYVMAIAKLILPLVTLPYLTRVLSEEVYGFVSYVKSCMTYMTLIIDFGFILSSVKDITNANGDLKKIGEITGDTFVSKFILVIISGAIMIIMCSVIPVLKTDYLFVFLSFVAIALNIFLADFLFRGIEKMHYITLIFVVAKSISSILTFVFVKNDSTVMWIPILDILAHLVSILISFVIIKKLEIKARFTNLKNCLLMIKDSFFYFLSSIATTAFTALNTLLIGIYIKDLTQIAHWSLCMNIITAIQGLYTPICNGIYPHMIKTKDLNFIHKILLLVMPVVILGCACCFFFAKFALFLLGGEKYIGAYFLFRCMIPILFFSFPAQIYGWPSLGAIGKVKQTTTTTIISAVAQVLGIFILILFNSFNLISLALLRCFTEFILLISRMFFVYKNKKSFTQENYIKE